MNEATRRLTSIACEIHRCRLCPLHRDRRLAVAGEGPADARIMLVGEAPGRREDEQGRPFVGRSGRILNDILEQAGLDRKDLFITSVVKCRPERNRVPRKLELETCIRAHLMRQIAAIRPEIICLLGGVASRALLGIDRITEARGRIMEHGGSRFFPTYHPAAAGRSRRWYAGLLEDFRTLCTRFHPCAGFERS